MDKEEERNVLLSAMPYDWVNSAVESESPDFLCMQGPTPFLGVEVTELFSNESDARIKKVENYAGEILKDAAYRHKDDKSRLPVETVLYQPEEGQNKEFQAIVLRLPPVAERFRLFHSVIRKKAEKLRQYRQKAPATDLVVVDKGKLFSGGKKDQVGKMLSSAETRQLLQQSGFREVRLLIKDDTGQSLSIPSRLNIFAEEIAALEIAFKELPQSHRDKLSVDNHLGMLTEYLHSRGFRQCRWLVSQKKAAVLTDVAMCVFSKKGMELVELFPNTNISALVGEGTTGTDSEDQALSKQLSKVASEISVTMNIAQAAKTLPD